MSPGFGYVTLLLLKLEYLAAGRGTPLSWDMAVAVYLQHPGCSLLPQPALAGIHCRKAGGKARPAVLTSPAKDRIAFSAFLHISPSSHLFAHKFTAFLCCLLFAAMLGTLLAAPNWTGWGYWEAPELAHILLLQTCLHPAVC